MAKTTSKDYRNKVLYQVFPRQYSSSHSLKGVTSDLERIKSLGVDIVYLMPIHPIGEVARKGTIGSPYSIKDYRAIDKNLGTVHDLIELINTSHKLGMKVILDIVFNHTSKDSLLTKMEPFWFYQNENGDFKNRVGDWSDITDLKFNDEHLYIYLIETLKMYVSLGVDGFRFDVCSLIPYSFFEIAIPILKNINKDLFFFGESVHLSFTKYLRDLGYEVSSEGELYNLFDCLYEYDSYDYLERYMKGECSISLYLEKVLEQESIFPNNYIKARYIENHDFGSANGYLNDDLRAKNLLVLSYFTRGMAFLFNGIETLSKKRPNLFEIDEIDWSDYNKSNVVDLIKKLNLLKKHDLFKDGAWSYKLINEDVVLLSFEDEKEKIVSICNLNHFKGDIYIEDIKDGTYIDLISDCSINISNHLYSIKEEPIVINIKK